MSNELAERVTHRIDTLASQSRLPRECVEEQTRELLRDVFDEIEQRAEANMLRTQKLEGMHYAALKDVRSELNISRAPTLPLGGSSTVS